MNKEKKDITILTIGDRSDYDSYQKSNYEKKSFLDNGFEYITTNYAKVLKGKTPHVKTEKVVIFLFFPFSYWNKHIEHKNYKGVYGNHIFYQKFSRFWDIVEEKLKKHFADKKILFINNPRVCAAYRDKLAVIRKLAELNISQPQLHKISDIGEIQDRLARGEKFFLKPQYGSMGKGITFLSESNWQTNFTFKNNKIISRKSDHGWEFNDVTGNHKFLKQLLKKDILVQAAVDPPILKGSKMDLRLYTFFGKAIYLYPRRNSPGKVTTNISQGGKGAPSFLGILPGNLIKKAKEEASKVANMLDISLAGIDVIPDKSLKKVYVIDVNIFSGFPKRKTFNITQVLANILSQLDDKGILPFK